MLTYALLGGLYFGGGFGWLTATREAWPFASVWLLLSILVAWPVLLALYLGFLLNEGLLWADTVELPVGQWVVRAYRSVSTLLRNIFQ